MKNAYRVMLIGLAVIGVVYAGSGTEKMTREEKNKLLVNAVIEAFNEGDRELMQKLYSPKFVLHTGIQGTVSWVDYETCLIIARRLFPTLRCEIEDIIAEGEKVAVRLSWSATRKSHFSSAYRFGSKDETDRKVVLMEMAIIRIEGGRVVEKWCEFHEVYSEKVLRGLLYYGKLRGEIAIE